MSDSMIERMVELGNRIGFLFIATADKNGRPHIASARRVEHISGERFAVTEWFCPGTVANLRENPWVSVVAWDNKTDVGYQVVGESEKMDDVAMLDGFEPGHFETTSFPQIERRLVVRSESIFEFTQQPHSDLPLTMP